MKKKFMLVAIAAAMLCFVIGCGPDAPPPSDFVAVTNITGIPESFTENASIILSGTVVPADADYQDIVWSIVEADTTAPGAVLTASTGSLTATGVGSIKVRATIANGKTEAGEAYIKDFTIEVTADEGGYVAVMGIVNVPTSTAPGATVTLTGTVNPSNATNTTIVWSLKDAAGTGANLTEAEGIYTVVATTAGTYKVTATIANGATESTPFTADFDIEVREPELGAIDQSNATDSYHGTLPTTKNVIPAGTEGSLGVPVVHEVWVGVDTNNDPRNVLGYKLKSSDKQYFDNVVIFHFNLYDKDCANSANAGSNNGCNKSDIHLHFLDEIQWLMGDNYDKYIKPLKDAGMRVLMGLLPSGDGLCFGTLGSWPMEPVSSWPSYPYGEDIAKAFAKEVAAACAKYGFDGIAMDDEYGNYDGTSTYGGGDKQNIDRRKAVYPDYSGQVSYPWTATYTQAMAWKAGGDNVFKFLRYFKDYTTDSTHPNGKWVSNYEFHYLASLPTSLTVNTPEDADVTYAGEARDWTIDQVVDASFPASYGADVRPSTIGVSNSHYGFTSLKMYESPSPGVSQVPTWFADQLTDGYGIIMYFSLISRYEYAQGNFFSGNGSMPEKYFTRFGQLLYKDNVVFTGTDYRKFPSAEEFPTWAAPGDTTAYRSGPWD
jgi:hypothetical protein